MSELDFIGKGSCKLSYKWDWATDPRGDQELYRLNRAYVPEDINDPFNYGVDIIKTKNRVRGRGVALSMTLTSPAGKDVKILGLGVQYVGEGD